MSIIRWLLGRIILLLDWLTSPKRPQHSPEHQAELDQQTSHMALYEFQACPFCVKTRRAVKRLGLNIEIRDARRNPKWNAELVSEGGRYQVPCLRIDEGQDKAQWMYESSEIIDYLNKRFKA